MSEVNTPLLRKAVDWARLQNSLPWEISEWNQADWVANPEHLYRERYNGDAMPQSKYATPEYNNDGTLRKVTYYKAPECGTNYCIAGYIASISIPEDARLQGSEVVFEDGLRMHVSEFAEQQLGLKFGEAADLFSGGNSLNRVVEIASALAGEPL